MPTGCMRQSITDYKVTYYTRVEGTLITRHVVRAPTRADAEYLAISYYRRHRNAGPVSIWQGRKLVLSGRQVAKLVAGLS